MENITAIVGFRGDYFFLSNMYSCKVHGYRSAESAFQAAKCADPAGRDAFRNLSGAEAKKLGKRVVLRPDWEEIKLDVMYAALKCKFTENPELKRKLLATGSTYLEERNTWGDTYWGTVGGVGHNHLGELLMILREELGGSPEPKDYKREDVLGLALDSLADHSKIADMIGSASSEYHERFNADEHEYYATGRWTFDAKCGLRISIDTGKGCVETWSMGERFAKRIPDELLGKLCEVAEVAYSWEPDHVYTTSEKLRGYTHDGDDRGYAVQYWDDIMAEMDARYEEDTSWRDETVDYHKVVSEDWVAGAGKYMNDLVRDVQAKQRSMSMREDESEQFSFQKSYELRQFEAMQEKLKKEDPRKIWAQKKETPSWLGNRYKSEEPKVKAGVTVTFSF